MNPRPLAPLRLLALPAFAAFFGLIGCSDTRKELPPTVSITKPTSGQTIVAGDDEDHAAPGLQFSITADVAQVSDSITASLVIDGATVDGQTQSPSVTDGKVTVTFSKVTLRAGSYDIAVNVVDTKSNKTASDTKHVTVDTTGLPCDPSFGLTSPAVFNIDGTTPSGSGRTATVSGTTTVCPGQQVTLTKTVPGGQATNVGTATADSTGKWSVPVTFADGEADATLTAAMGSGSTAGTASLSYTADFTPPSFDALAPAAGAVRIVAAGDNRAGFFPDADATKPGGQLNISVTISGAGRIGNTQTGKGSLTISGATQALADITDQGAHTLSNQQLTFADGTAAAVTLTATDAAGNKATRTWNVGVALQALASPTLVDPAGTLNVFNDLKANRTDHIDYHAYVTFPASPSPGTQVYICTSVPAPGAASPCKLATPAATQVPGSVAQLDGGSNAFYADLQFPEGTFQAYAEAVDSVGDSTDSAPKAVTVDTVPPKVTGLTLSQDANNDKILNAAELPSGSAVTVVAQFSGVEDGQTATLTDGAQSFTAPVSSNSATFHVTGVLDGTHHTFKVTVTDKAGNPNESNRVSPPITNPEDSVSVDVVQTLPSISVNAPTFRTCNHLNDGNPGTAGCDLQFTVAVGAAANTSLTKVVFSGPGAPASAEVVPSGGIASAAYVVPDGPAQTLVATVYDAAGNTNQAQVTLLVKTSVPTVSITSPTSGATLNGQDFAVAVTSDAGTGAAVKVVSSGGQTIGTGTLGAGGTASVNVHAPPGSQTLTAQVTDAAGNVGTSAAVAVTVNPIGCDLTFTNPTSTEITLSRSTPGLNVLNVAGHSEVCKNQGIQVSFTVQVNGGSATSAGTATIDGSGNFGLSYTFANNSVTVFTAQATSGGHTSTASFTATTDITAPTLSLNGPAPTAGGTLYLVASAGNVHVAAGDVGYVADASSVPNGQLSMDLTVTGGAAAVGSGGGTLVVTDKSDNVLLSQALTDNGTLHYSPGGTPLLVTIPQGYQGALKFTVTDSVGNSTSASLSSVAVDVVPPPAPALTASIANERHADLDISFPTPADDGLPGQTVALSFGYSTSTVLTANGLTSYTEADFKNPALTTSVAVTAGSPNTVALRSVPPLNTYYLAARATDGVGNVSTFQSSTADVNWTREAIAYSGSSTTPPLFGYALATGDLDRDGKADFAVLALNDDNQDGSATIYYGSASFPLTRKVVFDGTGASWVNAVAIGDVDGDSYADLVLARSDALQIYFGSSTGIPTTPDVSIPTTSILVVASVVADFNKDGIADIVLGAPYASSGVGEVFAIRGRSKAAWASLVAANVKVETADVAINGVAAKSNLGGTARGIASVPDIDGDGNNEVYIGAPGINTGYLISGAVLAAQSGAVPVDALTPKTITAPAAPATARFGAVATAIRFDADSLTDLIIGDFTQNSAVYASKQASDHSFSVATAFDTGGNFYGGSLTSGDLTGDGLPDLLVGTDGTAQGMVRLYPGTSSGLGTTALGSATGLNGFGSDVAVADVNGDGKLDLIVGEVANQNGYVYVFH